MEQYMTSLLRSMAHEKEANPVEFMRDQFAALVGGEKNLPCDHDVSPGFLEVTLTSAEGLPDGSYLSLHGPLRAQAEVATLLKNGPWKLPFRNNGLVEPLKVCVLQGAGETRIQMHPQQHRYHVQLPGSREGGHASVMEIGLHLRHSGKRSSSLEPAHRDKLEHLKQVSKTSAMGAHQYLESNNSITLVKELLNELAKDKPRDPYRFLLERLERKTDSPACWPADADDVAHPVSSVISGSHRPGLESAGERKNDRT
jgi:hypothetical protein